ncbi:MAG: DUF2892 domain-containing protein [Chloroflexi bacterium]|nr:DUF2892 domain-containing protein [Chloroflexota bacterium]MDL1884865.1 DUF2892 domain-containing protein [Anaerolineae bacterium CFX8]
MVRNVGSVDRVVRLVLGAAVVLAGLYFQTWLGALGLIFIGTALIGWCPLYMPFGISTCAVKNNKA